MSDWITVTKAEELKSGMMKVIYFDDMPVMIINLDGDFFAMADVCTHDGGTLSDGEIEGCEIICPRHGARFDIKTGAVLSPPAYEDVIIFPLRVEKDKIQVRDHRWD